MYYIGLGFCHDITFVTVFPRRNGLICSWGCVLHALGFIFKFLVGTAPITDLCFTEIGWVAMVSGQAFVLYSRLNPVIQNQILLRCVLAAIIIDGLALHVPILIFIYGANNPSKEVEEMGRGIQRHGMHLARRIFPQEPILSGLYIFATIKLLTAIFYERTRRVMMQLVAINILCIAMVAILVGLEFSNNYFGEASAKPLIYAIKLISEFAVYRQVVGLTKTTFTAEKEDLASQNGKAITTPADFSKQIYNILAPPPAGTTPTVHTHLERFTKADNAALLRPKLTREWVSSQLELTANSIAAALRRSRW